jgi:hypothetical protein
MRTSLVLGFVLALAGCPAPVMMGGGTELGGACTGASECNSGCCLYDMGMTMSMSTSGATCKASSNCISSDLNACSILNLCPGGSENHCLSYNQCARECDTTAGPAPNGNCISGQCCTDGTSYGNTYKVCQSC